MDLSALLDALDAHDGPVPIETLKTLLEQATLDCACVAKHTHFSDDGYCRNPVREGEHYQALLLCWKDGQRSPIHDHRGSACGIHVIKGTLVEQCYELDDDGVARASCRNVLEAGSVCASHDCDKHEVIAEGGDLVTLHVYTPPMSTIGIYRADSDVVESYTYCAFQQYEEAIRAGD